MAKIIVFPKQSSDRTSSARALLPTVDNALIDTELLAAALQLRDWMVVVTDDLETLRQRLVTS